MIAATKELLQRYFRRRQLAYKNVFDKKNVFTQEVLVDLAKFCRAHKSTFNKDPRISAMMDGRREVFLRIAENLELSLEDLYDLHIAQQKERD